MRKRSAADATVIEDLLGAKWTIPIIFELLRGPRRFGRILQTLPGISTVTLTLRLRELEAAGIVDRRSYREMPPRVDYSLTLKGRALRPVLEALREFERVWGGTDYDSGLRRQSQA